MSETPDLSPETAAGALPTKRKPGRPRKATTASPAPESPRQEKVIDFGFETVTTASAIEDMETPIEGKNGVESPVEDGFGLARAVGENANDLVFDEAELENPAMDFGIEPAHEEKTPDEPEPTASGDVKIPLLVRELYVEALRDEAETQGISFQEYVQRLMDWWVENEFATIGARR